MFKKENQIHIDAKEFLFDLIAGGNVILRDNHGNDYEIYRG